MSDLSGTLEAVYGGVTTLVGGRTDSDFARPTRCEGLAVGPLLVHVLLDAQRALMAFATPATPPSDRDFVTYWSDFPGRPQNGSKPGQTDSLRFATRLASAYSRPADGLVRHWRDTSEAAARAAGAAPSNGYVGTQGHVLAVPDFVATLVFEAAVHHLDLALDLPDASGPPDPALDVVAATLDGLLGANGRDLTGWDTTTYALKGTGRSVLDPTDIDRLGDLAARLPLIG